MTIQHTSQQQAQPCLYLIKEAFPSIGASSAATIEGLTDVNHPLVPRVESDYVHNKELVIDLRGLFLNPFTEGLCIFGHTGTGKTSGVLQYCAATKRPVRSITANGSMTADDLIGFHALVAEKPGDPPVMRFNYGPLPLAMKEGAVLLINEVDMIHPAELAGLNDVLEGRPLITANNGGEVIHPHPYFRIIVTANSSGSGDESGAYQGVMIQNMASMDRYRFTEVGYLPEKEEIAILEKVVQGKIPRAILEKMVAVANAIRTLFMGTDTQPGTVSVPMSTRTLVRWARLTLQYAGASNPISLAFKKSFLLRASSVEKVALERAAKDLFGKDWD